MTTDPRNIDDGKQTQPFDLEQRVKATFTGCTFEIRWPYSRPLNPACEAVEVVLTTRFGDRYLSNFTTAQYIEAISEKNRETGECAGGIFFAMPGMVVLKEITPDTVRKTIDYMIEHLEIGAYFEKLDDHKE